MPHFCQYIAPVVACLPVGRDFHPAPIFEVHSNAPPSGYVSQLKYGQSQRGIRYV